MLGRILVPLDGTAISECALPYATELTRSLGGPLILLGPTEPYLEQHLARLQDEGLVVEPMLSRGDTPNTVVADVKRQQPDLVVVARQRRRPGRPFTLMHQLADSLLEEHVAPVLQVHAAITDAPSSPALRGTQVIVPLDGSVLDEAALPIAVELAHALDGQIVLLQVVLETFMPYAVPAELMTTNALDVQLAWDSSYAVREDQAYLERMASRVAREADGVRVSSEVRGGGLAEQIRLISADALTNDPPTQQLRLIVMATRGRHGLGRWLLGSATADVMEAVDIPVLAVPAQPVDSSARV